VPKSAKDAPTTIATSSAFLQSCDLLTGALPILSLDRRSGVHGWRLAPEGNWV